MCGIVGVRRSFLADRGAIDEALASLSWRGPDSRRLVDAGEFVVGVARLAITDPDADQPLVSPRTGHVIAFNGAVTSASVERARVDDLRTGNDAELVLARFAEHGETALLDHTGPYAFAVIDPATDTLWLGRDPEREKPLYVVDDGKRVVAFASSIAALRALGLRPKLDDDERARFVRFGFTLGAGLERTDLRLSTDLAGLFVDRPDDAEALVPVPAEPAATVVTPDRPVADALRAAVTRCTDAEVAVGLALSGGVDSACIAACLREAGRTVPCYQFRALGEPDDERRAAQVVARHLNLTLRPVESGPALLRTLPALTAATGWPLGDPSVLAAHSVACAAAADGVRVMVSGEGADDLLLGYARHRAAAHLPRRGFQGFPSPGLSTRRSARLWRALTSRTPYDRLLEVSPPAFRKAALTAALAKDAAGALPSGPGKSALERARDVDRRFYLRRDLLPKLDTALMAAGVEGRCPFLDPEVLVSREVRAEDPREIVGKRALRAAFAPMLPEGHFDRPKRGLALPLDRWWREDDFLADVLLDERSLARPWLRTAGVRRLVDRQRNGKVRLGHALYTLVALELHARATEAIDSPEATEVE